MKKYILAIALVIALGVQAQEVSTLYFLENAPMRHLVNPAFQPISKGYVNFSPLGYSSVWAGNSDFTFSDFIYTAPNGRTITVLHPEYGNKQNFLKSLPPTFELQEDATLNWFGFGFRIKEKGYFTFQSMLKVDSKQYMSSNIIPYFLDGSQISPTSTAQFNIGASGLATQIYDELAFGYSHKINDIWTVGGKLKFLIGTAYIGANIENMDLTGNAKSLRFNGQGDIMVAGPLNFAALPSQITYETFGAIDYESLLWLNEEDGKSAITKFVKPSGFGAALDLGFTATPVKYLQISVGLNDLGFIHWNNATQYTASVDTTFTGVGPLNYGDYVYDGQFQSDSLFADVTHQLEGLANATKFSHPANKFNRMITTKLNIGIDGRFFDNRLTLGVLSKTMLYNGHLNEELTFGIAGKPANWFNIALSYSLFNNGKSSNIGAGLSFMPYDGINFTIAADYIPLHYATIGGLNVLPTRSQGLNIAMGFSIVWGTNPKKAKVALPSELETPMQPIEQSTEQAATEQISKQTITK